MMKLLGSLLFLGLLTVQTQAEDSKGNRLPLVFDPLTKKYFIGGNSKFLLKQSEQSQLVERIEVSVDGGDYQPYGEAVQFKEEGKHTLKFRAVTSVNNWSPVQFVEVFVDLTSPTSEMKFPDEKYHTNEKGTYVALNTAVTLVSQDNLSGVANIEHSWDGQNFSDYTKPLVLDKTGPQTIYYRSNDRVGNTEVAKKVDLVVDGTSPTSSLKLQNADRSIQANGKTYFSDSVAFGIEAQDDVSQVRQIWVTVDGGKAMPYIKPIYFLQEGPHTLKYYAVDFVGNKELEKSVSVFTVSTPPQTILTTVGKIVNTGGNNYAQKNFQLKLEATNNAAGLEKIEVRVDSEGGSFQPYIEPIQFKTSGFHTVSYRARDRVGNSEPTKTFNVTIHETPPETTIATAQPLVVRNSATYSPAPNVVTFNVSNSTVGVEKTLVSLNDAPFVPYQGPITLNSDKKTYKIAYKSVDKLGNEEQAKIMTFHMIGAIPIVDLFISNGQSAEEQVRTNYLEQPAGQTQPKRAPANAPVQKTAPPVDAPAAAPAKPQTQQPQPQ